MSLLRPSMGGRLSWSGNDANRIRADEGSRVSGPALVVRSALSISLSAFLVKAGDNSLGGPEKGWGMWACAPIKKTSSPMDIDNCVPLRHPLRTGTVAIRSKAVAVGFGNWYDSPREEE